MTGLGSDEVPRTGWRRYALLYAIGALAAFQYAKVPWMLPGLQAEVPMTPLMQAFFLSIIGMAGVLGGATAGGLCRRIGLRRSLQGGLLLGVFGSLLPLAGGGLPVLFAARLIESVAHLALVVAVPTSMLACVAEAARGRAMVLWSCYFTATFLVTALVAPRALALGGWPSIAIAHALLLAVAYGLLARMPLPAAADGTVAGGPTHRVRGVAGLLHAQRQLFRHRRLIAVPLTFCGYTFLFVALVSVLPARLATDTADMVRLAWQLPFASLLGTGFATLALARGLPPIRLAAVAAAGLVLLAMVIGFAEETPVLPSVAAFFLLGILPAGIFALVPQLFAAGDPDLPVAQGGIAQFGNLGNLLGAPVFTLATLGLGALALPLYVLGAALMILACLVALVVPSMRAAGEPGGGRQGLTDRPGR